MLERLKHTASNSLIYGIGNLFTKLVGLLLLPIYTSFLTVAEYGILAVLESTMNFLFPLISLNIQFSIQRFVAAEKSQKNINVILWNAFAVVFFTSLFFNVLLQPFAENIAVLLFKKEEYTVLIRILLINTSLLSFIRLLNNFFNAKEMSKLYTFFKVIQFSAILVFTFYFLSEKKLGLKGVLLAQTFSYILMIIISIPFYFRYISLPRFSKKVAKKMIAYSGPLAFSTVSNMVLSFGDRYVLNFIDTERSVGLYSLGTKFVNTVNIAVIQAFQLSYLPYSFKHYESDSFKYFHKKITTYSVLLVFYLTIIVAFFANEILYIFSPKNSQYWEAAKYIPYLAFLQPLIMLRFMFSTAFNFTKKTQYIPFIVVSFAVLNIVLNVLLVPKYSVVGVIIASVSTSFLMSVVYYYFSVKLYRVKYEFKRIIIIFLYSSVFLWISMKLKIDNFWLSVSIKTALLVLYPVLLYVLGFAYDDEKEVLHNLVKKYWKNFFKKSQ